MVGCHVDITARRKAEEELRESEARLRTLYETVQAGIMLQRADGKILHANQVACDIFGMEFGEILGRTSTDKVWQMVLEDGTPVPGKEHPSMITIHTGQPIRNAIRGVFAKDPGRMRWLLINTEPIFDQKKEKLREVTITFQDITELKRAEEKLRQSEEKYRLVFENAPLGIMHYDQDGTITDLNTAFTAISGAPKERIVGFNMPRQLRDEQMRQAVEASLKGETGYYEGEYLSVTGGRATQVRAFYRGIFSEPGTFLGGIGMFEDYTDKFRAEQKQLEYLNFLQTLMDAIPNPIFYKDIEGRYLGCNKACEDAWGISREELIGKTVFDQHPRDLAAIYYARDMELLNRPGVQVYETSMAHTDGTRKDVIIHKATFSHLDGTLAGLIGIQVDITARKRAEERILSSLQEKEVLLKEIHHRVKNNLQIISTLLALQIKYRRNQDPGELFQDCQNRIRSMALIHESLYSTENLARINFRHYLEKLSARLLASYGSMAQGIKIAMAGTHVHLDVSQAVPCGLIANELLVNSLKHAFPGRKEGEIQVSIEDTAGRRVLEVRDNGVGLGPDFDLENPTTFGWMMVRNLAKQLGGDFMVQSNGGTSTRIVF
jgi:PAS domain S-box-containing protein